MSPTVSTAGAALRNDDLLISQVKEGSVDAFEELYDRYVVRAYRLAWSICHDRGCSEDAVHEAFLSVWNARGSYSPSRGTVAAWLLTAVGCRAIDVSHRGRKQFGLRASERTADLRVAGEDIAERAVAWEEGHRLRALLSQLPEAQREVIALAFYGELTHTEIAAALDLPTSTVRGRMRLGLQKIKTWEASS